MTDTKSPRALRGAPARAPGPGARMTPGSTAAGLPDGSGRRRVRRDAPEPARTSRGDDAQSGTDLLRSRATCSFAWRADGYEAIRVFVGPALRDRAGELCAAIEGWSGVHRDLDDLSDEILQYADREGLSAGIYPRPRDELSAGLVAISITIG